MKPEFAENIIEDLEKSGFSSELRAIRTFITAGWSCTGFANYFDLDQELVTSVDLRAWKEKEVRGENLTYGVQLNIDAEVKKSEKPWVVFKEKRTHIIDDYINNLNYICGVVPHRLQKAMAQESVYSKLQWMAYSIHESFKKPDAPSRSYSAFIKVCKSAESTLNATSAYYKEFEQLSKDSDDPFKERVCILVKPVVILDGNLIAAELSDTGEISVEEIKYAPVEFYYKSKHCNKGVYLIDIVTLDGLQEYIEISEKRLQAIFERIESLSVPAT